MVYMVTIFQTRSILAMVCVHFEGPVLPEQCHHVTVTVTGYSQYA